MANGSAWFQVWRRTWICLALLLIGTLCPRAAEFDLSEFKTVVNAARAQIERPHASTVTQSGYLGVLVASDKRGKLIASEVEPDSPAARAGLQANDVLQKLDGVEIKTVDSFRERLQSKEPGESLKLKIQRGRKTLELAATMGATSRPKKIGSQRAIMGILTGEAPNGDGVVIRRVTSGSPADKAGLKSGDLILKLDGVALMASTSVSDNLSDRQPGDKVNVTYSRSGQENDVKIELAPDRDLDAYTFVSNPRNYWKKDTYRLAAICVDFPDEKHNPAITLNDWERSLFSHDAYKNATNATGQSIYGSLADYYHEISCGALKVEGKVFDWVEVSKKRAEYAQSLNPSSKSAFLSEAMDLLLEREGRTALKDFDGVLFLYAGERYAGASRGSLYWPHRAYFTRKGERWSYFICPEGGKRMDSISVFCHEFGHMLGLPDLYARPENPGSEGLGIWCAMSNQSGAGRPQHFSAWCKEQLGWLKPAVINPAGKQKLILAPIENSSSECYKILIKPDGSEYLLLENRRKQGFDQSLPAEGLLIWHVTGNRPQLEESHGVEGPLGPRVYLSSVPYPSNSNNAYTPYTTPSSRSLLGGGLPVYITNIRKLDDGRIAFYIGYEFE